MEYDIFISYRREGGYDTAQLLYDRLTQMRYRVSFDLETLRGGKFNTQLYQRIEQCSDVLAIMSKDALILRDNPDDDWFRLEIAHALKCGKNIVPVFLRDFKFPPKGELPPDIADLVDYQGVTAAQEHFDSTLRRICKNFKARPRRRMWLAVVLSAVLALGAAAGFVWAHSEKIFPYPFTQEAKQNVGTIEHLLVRVATVYDCILVSEMRFLDIVSSSIDHGSGANVDAAYFEFVSGLDKLPYDLCVPSDDVLKCINSMPISKGTFVNLCDTVPYMRDTCKAKAKAVKSLFDNVYSNSEKSRFKRNLENKKRQNRIYGEYFAYGLMEALQCIPDSALTTFREEMRKWPSMNATLARRERNPATVQALQAAALERLRSANAEMESIVQDQRRETKDLDKRLVEISRKMGKTDEQIRREMEEVEAFAISNAIRKFTAEQTGETCKVLQDAEVTNAFRMLMDRQMRSSDEQKTGKER